MTPLAQILARRIAAEGPMSVADYMAECLLHPEHGYYATRDPFGAAGDFTTAPEISQMFGEMLGPLPRAGLARSGRPRAIRAGRDRAGARHADGRYPARDPRACRAWPRPRRCTSSRPRRCCAPDRPTTLAGHRPVWHDRVETLPDLPLFLVANEFFDALPIRQFERKADGWAERHVGLRDGCLAPGLGPVTRYPALAARLGDTRPGDVVEICPALPAIAAAIGARIAAAGGVALIVDYGGWHSLGDTLQALKAHQSRRSVRRTRARPT